MITWIQINKEWVFGGIGILVITGIFKVIWYFFTKPKLSAEVVEKNSNNNTNNNVININTQTNQGTEKSKEVSTRSLEERKKITNILFIDDDTTFKVVKILKKSGWINTKIKKDVSSPDDRSIKEAHICFVDIQGVATDLFPKDEGLGLVGAIRDQYPDKKIVLYSAQRMGDRFNELLKKADASLGKDAEPYQFENLVDGLSKEFFK